MARLLAQPRRLRRGATDRLATPTGVPRSGIAWPVPVRIPVGPLANFGYDGATLLPVTLGVPKDVAASEVDLRADATWLVCNQDECIPGAALLSLTLPVDSKEPGPSRDAPLFEKASQRLPIAAPTSWRFSVRAETDALTLTVRGVAGSLDPQPLFFPFDREVIEHAAPQALTRCPTGSSSVSSERRRGSSSAPSTAC
jgi:DsbC/DsbD-like thiol-disulfide interchange protein